MPHILQRRTARLDILDHFEYLDREAGEATALRFISNVQETFQQLARMPRMGHLCEFRNPELADLRRWPVAAFEDWLLFYRAMDDGIEVLRILHGSRDLVAIFERAAVEDPGQR